MKIDIKKVKQIPKEIVSNFGVCVFGDPDQEVMDWIVAHGFRFETAGPYTNIYVDKPVDDVFYTEITKFDYIDGFSPNLNKHLHLGHLANLILAKAFVGMGLANDTIAILGDTLDGDVSKSDALDKYKWYCDTFNYKVSNIFYASEMKCDDSLLTDGDGAYNGTKVFIIGDEKIVGIKSDGSTSYFYQDVALGQMLKSKPILYLTGHEQNSHFKNLKTIFPQSEHIGLGLVKAGSQKMSSRVGNVIYADGLLEVVMSKFNGDPAVAYNVIAGHILKSAPKSDKNIDLITIDNPLNSLGLYMSYTLAKMKSAGVKITVIDKFNSNKLQFKLMKAQQMLSPNLLFDELVEHAKNISQLYTTHKIKGDADNEKMFGVLASDLSLGLKMLGMLEVERV